MKNIYKPLFITLIFVIILIIITLMTNIVNILKYEKIDYYNIGNEQVPSIYKVLGKRKLYSYRSNSNSITLKYKNINNVKSDLSNYITVLKNDYDYIYTSNIDFSKDEGTLQLSTNSIEEDKIIIINIDYKNNEYKINIIKDKGKINFYK